MRISLLTRRLVRLAIAVVFVLAAMAAVTAHETTFEVVAHFEDATRNGARPIAPLLQASDGRFYGTTTAGGRFGRGTIFSISAAGELTSLHDFAAEEGVTPVAALIQGSDESFYGTTLRGGTLDFGTVFKFDSTGTLITLHSFTGAEDGKYPEAGLVQASDGRFYGTTTGVPLFGPSGPGGTVFRIDAAGTFTTLHRFTDGRQPHGELSRGPDGNLYGATRGPSSLSQATIFKLDLAGTVTTVRTLASGQTLAGPFRVANEGYLYAVATPGDNVTAMFIRIDAAGTLSDIPIDSTGPLTLSGNVVEAGNGDFYGVFRTTCVAAGALPFAPDALTDFSCDRAFRFTLSERAPLRFHDVQTFDLGEESLSSALTLATDGSFYATMTGLSESHPFKGGVFKYSPTEGPAANVTLLHVFGTDSPGGGNPMTGVIQGFDGRLYGTASTGGAFSRGTVFTIDAAGIVQAVHSFQPSYGSPQTGLVQGGDGNFYGTTGPEPFHFRPEGHILFGVSYGGIFLRGRFDSRGTSLDPGDGWLYITSMGPPGLVSKRSHLGGALLYDFPDPSADGSTPMAGLIKAHDGSFYGTTSTDGPGTQGTIFKLIPNDCPVGVPCGFATFFTVYAFSGPDGATPLAPLRLGSDGRFYGTTSAGGSSGGGTAFALDGSGNLATLHNFGGRDGLQPLAGLLQASDGNVYGTTCLGGASYEPHGPIISDGYGTVFRIDATGGFTTLHSFSVIDGSCPSGELIQASDGHLYGTTRSGGPQNAGVLFRVRLMTSTSDQYFEIVSRNSGKCLDVVGASTDPAAPVIQRTCDGGANQHWRLVPVAGSGSQILARHSGQALDVYGALLDDVTPIIQFPVTGGYNQAWTLEPAGDGYVSIVARHSGKALDVEFASPDDGSRVIQYTPHGGGNQQWLLRAVPSTAGAVSPLSAR